jgi:type VII secretion protein EccB
MSSKRDLVEAHSFNRRRLITAFISGAPGGREVEPVRYGRTLIGGMVLAVLMVAGAGVAGLIKPGVPDTWLQDGLVVGKESGARFLASGGVLYPVLNTTSARLLLAPAPGGMKVTFVPDDTIAKQKPGSTVGIPGAPDVLPDPDNLVQSNWTACLDGSDIDVRLDSHPHAKPVPEAALLVRPDSGSGVYLVAGQHRYLVPAEFRNSSVRALRLSGEGVRTVPSRWLDLIPIGSELKPFTVAGAGDRVDTGVQGLNRVGTPVRVDGQPNVLMADGRLSPMKEFAYAIYTSTGPGEQQEVRLSAGDAEHLGTEEENKRPDPADWPQQSVSAYGDPTAPNAPACLVLRTDPTDAHAATVTLANVAPDAVTAGVQVESGHGSLVRASSGGVLGRGTVYLVDATGTSYAVGQPGRTDQPLQQFGYANVEIPQVPLSWTYLFQDGPALNSAAASVPVGGQK